jgi:hypothetical protein
MNETHAIRDSLHHRPNICNVQYWQIDPLFRRELGLRFYLILVYIVFEAEGTELHVDEIVRRVREDTVAIYRYKIVVTVPT